MTSARDVIRDYGYGRMSVEDFLKVYRSYPGPAPHFLLSDYNDDEDDDDYLPGTVFFQECLRFVAEDEMLAFLQALVKESPEVLTLVHRTGGGLLHYALRHTASRRIHRLLSAPENSRLLDGNGKTPIHVACEQDAVAPAVIRRLIDLDPDVLTLTDHESRVPLHGAMLRRMSHAYVPRMILLRPEAMQCRDATGRTPVGLALELRSRATPEWVDVARWEIERHPRSVALRDTAMLDSCTPLMAACRYWRGVPDLVRTVLDAHPASVVVPHRFDGGTVWLPFDMGIARRGENLAFIRDETVHMTLAVVEYVLGVDVTVLAAREAESIEDSIGTAARVADNVAWFQGHIRHTLRRHVPGAVAVEGESGLSVALNLLGWWRGRGQANDSAMGGFLDALLCHDKVVKLLRAEASQLRSVVLCETVVDLYRMNRVGRYYRPMADEWQRTVVAAAAGAAASDRTANASTVAADAMHQIELLASLKDSGTVESTYLQFREVSHHALIVHGPADVRRRHRKRAYDADADSNWEPEQTNDDEIDSACAVTSPKRTRIV